MATNHYFNNLRASNEQNLLEDLTVETIKIKGMDVIYIPRTLVAENKILGEDPISRFADQKPIEMYLETVNGFDGQGDLFSKLGLQVKDSATLVVAKRRFEKETRMVRPMEGDLIYLPMTKGVFEIKFVEHENPFYQLGKNYAFKLSVELFQFSQEEFATGDSEVDEVAESVQFKMYFTLTGGTGTIFAVGDTVYQYSNGSPTGTYADADASAIVQEVSGSDITVTNIIGAWYPSTTTTLYATSQNNATYRVVTGISDSIDASEYDDNLTIETKADSKLDFNIPNPFGTP